MGLKALILTGYGINCEQESRYAIERSGGRADIVHVNKLLETPSMLAAYNMLMIPGGFSFGDDLGSGKVFANKMGLRLKEPLESFISSGKLVLGICNGFQILVKMGMLPDRDFKQKVTIGPNDSGRFEDRWVMLKADSDSPCIYTKDIDYMLLPVRHGEGKFIPGSEGTLKELQDGHRIPFRYVDGSGRSAGYPFNPNGSVDDVAGICDESGLVFGMMPHPEAFSIPENCPYWRTMKINEGMGLRVFKNAVEYAELEGI